MSRSFSYERYDSRRRPVRSTRSTFGYWVPLVVTVTIAAGGLAAWVWSARDDHESTDHDVTSDDENLSYGEEARAARERYGRSPRPGGSAVSEGVIREDEYASGGRNGLGEETFVGGIQRGVQEVVRRTPSPQQAFDSVKKFGAAGIAAAGAAVGGALSAIREESTESRNRRTDRRTEEGFSDHERWSEEAENRHSGRGVATYGETTIGGPKQYTGGRRKMVAIVVSSEILLDNMQEEDGKVHSEHAVSASLRFIHIHQRLSVSVVVVVSLATRGSIDDFATDPDIQSHPFQREDSTSRAFINRVFLCRDQHTGPNTWRRVDIP